MRSQNFIESHVVYTPKSSRCREPLPQKAYGTLCNRNVLQQHQSKVTAIDSGRPPVMPRFRLHFQNCRRLRSRLLGLQHFFKLHYFSFLLDQQLILCLELQCRVKYVPCPPRYINVEINSKQWHISYRISPNFFDLRAPQSHEYYTNGCRSQNTHHGY